MKKTGNIILDEKDYNFIDYFCNKHNIREGEGIKNNIAIIINEYKKKCDEK